MTLFGQHFVLEEKKNSKEKKKREKKRERERERKREREKKREEDFYVGSTIFPFFFQFEKRCFTQFNETEREDCDD